jgi:hypothetical protein
MTPGRYSRAPGDRSKDDHPDKLQDEGGSLGPQGEHSILRLMGERKSGIQYIMEL